MKITKIETYFVDYPLAADFHPSWIPGYTQSHNRCGLIKLYTDEGLVGYGTCAVFSEDQCRMVKLIAEETVGQFLIGVEPFAIERHAKLVDNFAHMLGGRPWLLEVALWDLIGKAAGQPLYKLLGGLRDEVRVYASTGEVRSPEERVESVLRLKEQGFTAVKLRARSADYRQDIDTVEAVCAVVEDSMDIMVDANQGWSLSPIAPVWDYDIALDFCLAMEDLGLLWVEEPLYRYDYEGLSKLAAEVDIKIAGGELNQGLHEFVTLLDYDSLDVFQPDATLAGGILMCKKVATLCEIRGKWFTPHTWTNGFGLAANLQIAASIPNCPIIEYPIEPPGWTVEARDILLTEPLVTSEGTIKVPQKPGVGVEINEEILEKYGTRL